MIMESEEEMLHGKFVLIRILLDDEGKNAVYVHVHVHEHVNDHGFRQRSSH